MPPRSLPGRLPVWDFRFVLFGITASCMPLLSFASVWLADLFFISAALILISRPMHWTAPATILVVASSLCAAGVLTASVTANDPAGSVLVGVKLLYVVLFLPWVFRACSFDLRHRLVSAIEASVIGGCIATAAAIAQLFGLTIPGSEIQNGRASGLSGHPNAQGGLLGVAAAFAFTLFLTHPRKPRYGFYLIIVSAGLLASGSISGMLSAVAGIVAAIVVLRPRASVLRQMLPLSFVVVLIGYYLLSAASGTSSPVERFQQASGEGQGPSTVLLRVETYDVAWTRIQHSPIVGYGLDPGSGVTVNGDLAHNMLLLAWLQGGLLFLTGLLVLFVAALLRLFLGLAQAARVSGALLTSGVIASLVGAQTGPQLLDRWFWVPIILVFAVGSLRCDPPLTRSREHS